MRIPVRNIVDGCLSAVSQFFTTLLDAALFGVFRSHLRQAIAVERYRPVYLRSGRRNRVRY
jgi:hypothetical protein